MAGTRYTNVAGIADYLAISQRTVERMVAERRIPFTRIGERTIRFDLRRIDEWLEANSVKASA